MPQASDELRAKMLEWFGDEIDDKGPIKLLREAGYKLTNDFQWVPKPGVSKWKDMTPKEQDCMDFLFQEWDFGGMILP